MARAKGDDFFTFYPRRLRKYDNRGATVTPEIYTHRLSDCYCGAKRTVAAWWAGQPGAGPAQIDLPGVASYDAGASGHGAVW
jgi:hypothetical protein